MGLRRWVLCVPIEIDGMGGIGKLNARFLKLPENGEIDGLLDVHVDVVIGRVNPVDNFKIKGVGAVRFEMGPVETHLFLGFDNFAKHHGNRFELLYRCLVKDPDGEDHPAFNHAFVVADTAGEQIRI